MVSQMVAMMELQMVAMKDEKMDEI